VFLVLRSVVQPTFRTVSRLHLQGVRRSRTGNLSERFFGLFFILKMVVIRAYQDFNDFRRIRFHYTPELLNQLIIATISRLLLSYFHICLLYLPRLISY
jgi:hypothetical protein